MLEEELIALDCPYCHGEIFQPLQRFKATYFTCPACGGGLAADQFAPRIAEIEEALEARIAEMLQTPPGCGGGCHCGKTPDRQESP